MAHTTTESMNTSASALQGRLRLRVGPIRKDGQVADHGRGGRDLSPWWTKAAIGGPLSLVLLTACSNATAGLPTGQVQRVIDGDTVVLTTGEHIRLACISADELRGRNANPVPALAAKAALNAAVAGRTVAIRRVDTDRYGRTVAELFLGPLNIGQQLVATGHATIYERYAKPCSWASSAAIRRR
jgi:endonuclease YncB( thermonuclease family)